jgi:hypothetical protein
MISYLKAIVAGLIAGLASLESSLANGSLSLRNIIASIIALLIAFSAVAFTPGNPSSNTPEKETKQ